MGIGVCVSIQFGVLESTKRFFANQNLLKGKGGEGGRTLSGDQLFVAGVIAGLANGVVSGPVEHIRIREYQPSESLSFFSSEYQGCKHSQTQNPRILVLSMQSRKYTLRTVSPAFIRDKQ